MATLNPTFSDKDTQLQGGGPAAPPPRDFGDGDPERGPAGGGPGYYERLRRYRMGVGVGLVSVVMIFVSLTSAYIVRQGMGQWDDAARAYATDWRVLPLPDTLLIINTLILLASSLTLEMARRSINRHAVTAGLARVSVAEDPEHSVPWLGITLVLGMAFVGGQLTAWRELQRSGILVGTNPSSSFFYVLTGTHGLHLFGGLVALLYAALTPLLHKPLDTRRIVVDVAGWYWHFMALLWLYIYGLLHFMK